MEKKKTALKHQKDESAEQIKSMHVILKLILTVLKEISQEMVVTRLHSLSFYPSSSKFQVSFCCFGFHYYFCLKFKSFIYSLGNSINSVNYLVSESYTDFGSVILNSECINKQMLTIAN